MTRNPLLISLIALAAPVLAMPAMASDARIAIRPYNADEVVRIPGRSGVQASIAFAEDERIENVAVGDSAAWQVTPNKRANVLFLKPLAPRVQTNMTVITDRHTYFFDLVAGAGGSPLYLLRFTYPDAPRTAATTAASSTLSETEAQALTETVRDAAIDPATLNFAWQAKGKASLLPVRIYDDGHSTFISWAAKAAIPAIQVRNEKGTEGPVNFAVRDDVIVIDGVPDLIVLRSGRDMATLKRSEGPLKSAERKDQAETAAPAASPPTLATTQTLGKDQ